MSIQINARRVMKIYKGDKQIYADPYANGAWLEMDPNWISVSYANGGFRNPLGLYKIDQLNKRIYFMVTFLGNAGNNYPANTTIDFSKLVTGIASVQGAMVSSSGSSYANLVISGLKLQASPYAVGYSGSILFSTWPTSGNAAFITYTELIG